MNLPCCYKYQEAIHFLYILAFIYLFTNLLECALNH